MFNVVNAGHDIFILKEGWKSEMILGGFEVLCMNSYVSSPLPLLVMQYQMTT
jgi:hypothetical protein